MTTPSSRPIQARTRIRPVRQHADQPVRHWRPLCRADKLRHPPEYPDLPFLLGYFSRFHGAFVRGAEQTWIDTLPAEERDLQVRIAAGLWSPPSGTAINPRPRQW